MVTILGEGCDLGFEIFLVEVVYQQNAVLECSMPALNHSLCLWMTLSAMDLIDLMLLQAIAEGVTVMTSPLGEG